MQPVEQTLKALRQMNPRELRDKYLEVFGEPSRSGNKNFLFKRIACRRPPRCTAPPRRRCGTRCL